MNEISKFRPAFRPRAAVGCGAVIFTVFTAGCIDTVVRDDVPTEGETSEPATSSSPVSTTTDGVDAAVSTTLDDTDVDAGEVESSSASEVEAGSSSETQLDAGSDAASQDAEVPLTEGAPLVNTSVSELDVDVFGTFDNRYWFIATPEQVEAINNEFQGGGGGGWIGGDLYTPGSGAAGRTVDHLLVTTPDGKTADFGEMQVKLVGQSTGRPWTPTTLPNIKIDADDVTPEMRLGGYEHIRFNNGVWGSIFNEKFVFDYYRALGYPAPLASYGWVSSTVWGPDIAVPYIVVESYKRGFCRNREDYFGGECPNMWEFAQDLFEGVFDYPENCQFEECESTRANEFASVVSNARYGVGTIEDVGQYLDWDRFHEFQCLSWIFGTSDDAIHGGNNTVWVERSDGKFQLLPYSVDLSMNLTGDVALTGYTSIPQICQNDEQCWADTIATCGRLVDAIVESDPVQRLDELYAQIDAAGMLRSGDDGRYAQLRDHWERRLTNLPTELEYYRDNPNQNYCQYPYADCGGSCVLPQDCYLCQDWYYEQGGTGVIVPVPTVVAPPEPVPFERAADIALPLPIPVDPPPTVTNVPPPPPPPVDGGVVGDGGVEYPKPDFCYWEVPEEKPPVGRELYLVK